MIKNKELYALGFRFSSLFVGSGKYLYENSEANVVAIVHSIKLGIPTIKFVYTPDSGYILESPTYGIPKEKSITDKYEHFKKRMEALNGIS